MLGLIPFFGHAMSSSDVSSTPNTLRNRNTWLCLVGGPILAAIFIWMPWTGFWSAVDSVAGFFFSALAVVAGLCATAIFWNPAISLFVSLSVLFSVVCFLIKSKDQNPSGLEVSLIVAVLLASVLTLLALLFSKIDYDRVRLHAFVVPASPSVVVESFDRISPDLVKQVATDFQRDGAIRIATRTRQIWGEAVDDLSDDEVVRMAVMAVAFETKDGYTSNFGHASCRHIQRNYQASGKHTTDRYVLTVNGREVSAKPSPTLCGFWGFQRMNIRFRT